MRIGMLLLLGLFCSMVLATEDFYQDQRRGFVWFETIPAKEKNKQKDTKPVQTKAPEPFSWTREREKLSKALTEALDRFVMNPQDLEAAHDYFKKQQAAMERSHQGVRTATLAKLIYPELDYERQAPHNPHAKLIKDQEIQLEQETATSEIAKTHGLMFFFEGGNKNSEVMGKTVKTFADKYGFYVTPITLNGKGIKDYPNSTQNNNLVKHYKVEPPIALFALNPSTGVFFPLAHRIASISEMEQVTLGFQKFSKGEVKW